jgi:DNA-binding IscR family transcriptional regulator
VVAVSLSLKQLPESITLLSIYEAIEGSLDITDCPMAHDICGFDNCIMGNVVNKMTTEFKRFLNDQSLKEYL